jgi:hypothetical protein
MSRAGAGAGADRVDPELGSQLGDRVQARCRGRRDGGRHRDSLRPVTRHVTIMGTSIILLANHNGGAPAPIRPWAVTRERELGITTPRVFRLLQAERDKPGRRRARRARRLGTRRPHCPEIRSRREPHRPLRGPRPNRIAAGPSPVERPPVGVPQSSSIGPAGPTIASARQAVNPRRPGDPTWIHRTADLARRGPDNRVDTTADHATDPWPCASIPRAHLTESSAGVRIVGPVALSHRWPRGPAGNTLEGRTDDGVQFRRHSARLLLNSRPAAARPLGEPA